MIPRIRIVDDEPAIRSSLARHYRLRGLETDTAENGNMALILSDTWLEKLNRNTGALEADL